jgi:hypothetical protein
MLADDAVGLTDQQLRDRLFALAEGASATARPARDMG